MARTTQGRYSMVSLLPYVLLGAVVAAMLLAPRVSASEKGEGLDTDLKGGKVPSVTDAEVTEREARSTAPSKAYSEEELAALEESRESFEFQSDVSRIMNILIHSVYTNREVFLRELISNASDALDKIRLQSLTEPSVLDSNKKLEIRVRSDAEANTLTIFDSGLGMTKEELAKNLGTIAHSGTKKFAEMLGSKDASSNLIGQFGVGFYSAFLVADRVVVTSKSNDDADQWIWESSADANFSIMKDPRGNTLGRGTSITLHMKPESDTRDFLKSDKLRDLIIRYSDFISFPIYLWESHPERVNEKAEDDKAAVADESTDDVEIDEDEEDEDEDEIKDTAKQSKVVLAWDWERINDKQPIWTRRKEDISEEEYANFYESITREDVPPLTYVHFTAEGDNGAFKAIMFLPEAPPYSQFNSAERQKGVKLYVRRVFITEELDTLLPRYLAFLRGVVDSDDLPLNLSRETLQEHKTLEVIRNKLVRKTIAMFQQLGDAETEEEQAKYSTFWKSYGTNIKLGIIEDANNRARLAKLLRYRSSTTGELASLDEYVERMKEGQQEIYYLAGETIDALKTSPLLEKLTDKGFEVLFAIDAIDEYCFSNLPKYDKYKLVNLAKEGVKLPGEEDDQDYEDSLKPVIQYIKKTFSSKISRVKISTRLSRSPCALVAESFGHTAQMEKVMRAQTLKSKDDSNARMWAGKKVLEINPTHPIIVELNQLISSRADEKAALDVATLLVDTAAISSGYNVDQPAAFVTRVLRMVSLRLDLDADKVAVEPEVIVAEDDTADASYFDEL